MDNAPSLIDLRHASRTVEIPDADPLTILADVSLTVDRGEHVSIVGRSGSGKSTLLNILGMIDAPTTGEQYFDGVPIAALSGAKRDRLRGESVGFIFQQFNLLAGRTALENVATPLLYATGATFWRRTAIATEMLERVGLGHRLTTMPDRLSGGEQQRVAIARALVRSPRLILADEPTGALDVDTGQSVMGLLDGIVRESGSALVTITHDPNIAALADRHYLLEAGRLVAADRREVTA